MTKTEIADRETEQGLWQYVETPLAAEVRAGDIVLRPHWRGALASEDIRIVVQMASAAPALYEAAKKAANELSVMLALNPARDGGLYREALDALNAALALVNKPASQTDSE